MLKTRPDRTGKDAPSAEVKPQSGRANCFICSHTVDALVIMRGKVLMPVPGQNCPRCGSTLDASYVMLAPHAG